MTVTAETLEGPPEPEGSVDSASVAGATGTSQLGALIDRYVVLSTLGAGAMGIVYAAYDPRLDRKVALKLVKQQSEPSPRLQQRLQREAQALAKLGHPNVVGVYDVGVHERQLFIAMEFVAGRTLRDWLSADEPRDWRATLSLFVAAGRGLMAAHGVGLVHRDIKPDNVMLGDDGRVRITDFGLASTIEDHTSAASTLDDELAASPSGSERLTQTGALIGTPAYMSPEQWLSQPTDARSDQFSFCVSLYEALYGQPPFPRTSMAARRSAIESGTLAAPPRQARVPARIHRALVRGLAWDPDRRWPSMAALLEALTDEPGKRWRRRVTAALVVAGCAGGALALAPTDAPEAAPVCAGMQVHLDGVWGEPERARVRAAIVATGLSYAAETSALVERSLDDYTSRWVAARVAACEATHRGEQSELLLDRRMACLDERLAEVRATVLVLADADAEIVERAADALTKLPRLDHCADVDALLAEVPPPEDRDVAARVAGLQARLIQARALANMAKYEAAVELVEAIIREAEPLAYAPVELRAQLLAGELQRELGDYAKSVTAFERAYDEALRRGMLDEAARAATELMGVIGQSLMRADDGARWARQAELLSEATGDRALARYFDFRGGLSTGQGDYAGALASQTRALELRERLYGPEDPAVATTLNNLSYASRKLGRYDEAMAYIERSLAIDERVNGPNHPMTASGLYNLGNLAKAKGDLDAATRHHERALDIRERALGPEHPDVAGSYDSLGSLAKRRGEHEQARAYYLRALSIFEAQLGPEHPHVAGVLTNLGSVSRKLGELDAARGYLDRALTISERALGPDHPNLGITLYNLGELATAEGDHARAREIYERTLALFERSFGPTHSIVADTATQLGGSLLALGDPDAALVLLERAMTIHAETEPLPDAVAQTRFLLARALTDARAGRDRARAIELAELALADADDPLRAEIEAWLAAQGSGGLLSSRPPSESDVSPAKP